MKPIYKIPFTIFALLIVSEIYAQTLPDISYQDYGYTKPVKKVTQMYYSLGYAKNGSWDKAEEVEKITQTFNADGNIESYENQNFLDGTWAKAKSTYKNGRLHQQIWTHSHPHLNRTYTYTYNKQGSITKEKIRFEDGSKGEVLFHYQDGRLSSIESNQDGTQSVTERYYSTQGKLYKEIHRQKVPNEADIVTHYFYLEDQEILSYVAPKSYFYATAFLKDAMGQESGEIKFKLAENSATQDKLLQGIFRFEQEAPQDQLPFDLQSYSDQTFQAYHKNPKELIPFQITLYLRDENNHIKAQADVDVQNKRVNGMAFYQTEFTDGTILGSTEIRYKWRDIFHAMLEQAQIF